MSKVTLIKWGNSIGVRIPANELKMINAFVGEEFELKANKNKGLTLTPIRTQQAGWLDAFNAIADKNQDEMLIPHIENTFDQDEWQW